MKRLSRWGSRFKTTEGAFDRVCPLDSALEAVFPVETEREIDRCEVQRTLSSNIALPTLVSCQVIRGVSGGNSRLIGRCAMLPKRLINAECIEAKVKDVFKILVGGTGLLRTRH